MPTRLISDSYGKSAVRLTKVKRLADRHELVELDVAVQLTGDFAASYLTGDNSSIVATDTMKNTVYAIAAGHAMESIESFGLSVASHFLENNAHVRSATVELSQTAWARMTPGGKEHPHAFVDGGGHRRTATVVLTRSAATVSAGVRGLVILKTTDSEFWGFLRDAYTTLKETNDRILATSMNAQWLYSAAPADYNVAYRGAMDAMLDVFAGHHSLAVQQTQYAMGEAALAAVPEMKLIHLEMPNQHRIPFNLAPLGLENKNEIFVTTNEPYGLIKATVARD